MARGCHKTPWERASNRDRPLSSDAAAVSGGAPAPRPDVADGLADMPLTAVVWRGLHRQHRRQQSRDAALDPALEGLARQTHRLRSLVAGLPELSAEVAGELTAIADRLEAHLAQMQVRLLAPVGEAFEGELSELFESIAQIPEDGLTGPMVGHVVEPAILREGRLLVMGKAVIHVPARTEPTTPQID